MLWLGEGVKLSSRTCAIVVVVDDGLGRGYGHGRGHGRGRG